MDFKLLLLFLAMYVSFSSATVTPYDASDFQGLKDWTYVYPPVGDLTELEKQQKKGQKMNELELRGIHGKLMRSDQQPNSNLTNVKPSVGMQSTNLEGKTKVIIHNGKPCRITNHGLPIVITPLVKFGKEIKAMPMVNVPKNSTLLDVEGFCGFFTINATVNKKIFFWFFPAMRKANAPLVIRFQRGPLQTLFQFFNRNATFLRNPKILKNPVHFLYFSIPVSTDAEWFNYKKSEDASLAIQGVIAGHLHSALKDFLELFPQHKDNPVYVAADFYRDKYVQYFVKKILDMKMETPIDLKAILLNSPLLDPGTMFNSNRYLSEIGILDECLITTVSTIY